MMSEKLIDCIPEGFGHIDGWMLEDLEAVEGVNGAYLAAKGESAILKLDQNHGVDEIIAGVKALGYKVLRLPANFVAKARNLERIRNPHIIGVVVALDDDDDDGSPDENGILDREIVMELAEQGHTSAVSDLEAIVDGQDPDGILEKHYSDWTPDHVASLLRVVR